MKNTHPSLGALLPVAIDMKSPCIQGWYSWTRQSSSAADPTQLLTVQSLSVAAYVTHMTYLMCRPMSSTCLQSPCHRSENSWCPTAGRCWRECELMQQLSLDNHQKEGKGGWNYCINFLADWTGYDRRFEILFGVLMWCHWVNSSWCCEGLQPSSWTAWWSRWRYCVLSKFSEMVTHWCSVASQKSWICTELNTLTICIQIAVTILTLVIAGLMSHI